MQEMLSQDNIYSEDLEKLLQARERGEVDFVLVDVREQMEYDMGHIKGVDLLRPTTRFQEWAQELFDEYNGKKPVIFTCRTGSRSGQVQHIFKSNGFERAINHAGGIVTYGGEIER
jgi:rhodanese-related sulfurtransferase